MSQCENRCHIASRPNEDVLREQPFTLMSGVTSRRYASRVARKDEGDIRAMLLGHTPIARSYSADRRAWTSMAHYRTASSLRVEHARWLERGRRLT